MIGIALYKSPDSQPATRTPALPEPIAPTASDLHERFRLYLMEVFQMAGIYTPEEAFVLFVKPLQRIAEKQVEDELEDPDSILSHIYAEMERVEKAHNLRDGAFWRLDQAPPEFQRLNRQWRKRVQEITAAVFREYGENDIADLYLRHPDEFSRRMRVGGQRLSQWRATWLDKLNDWLS